MPHNHSSTPFTVSTAVSLGAPSSTVIGAWKGTGQASKALTAALHECNSSARDSLLKSLDHLFREPADLQFEDIVGLDLCPQEIKDMLRITANCAASAVSKLSIFPATAAAHSSQLAFDIVTATRALITSIRDPQALTRTREASTLHAEQEIGSKQSNFSANCRALCDNLGIILHQLELNIKAELDAEGKFAKSHVSMANTGASTMAVAAMGTAGIATLGSDSLGSLFREITAISLFSQQECKNPHEKNIYQALSHCSKTFNEKPDSINSFAALFALEEALLNFKPAADMSQNHSASAPYGLVLIRSLTSAPFLSALRAANSSAIALSIFTRALSLEQDNLSLSAKNSVSEASALEVISEKGAKNHFQNLSQLSKNFEAITAHFDALLGQQPLENGKSSIASLAKSTALFSEAVTGAFSLMIGSIGAISREISGVTHFTRHDQGTKKESKVVLQTQQDKFGKDLDKLMTRVSALQERIDRCHQLGVSAPVALGLLENAGSGALSLTLQSLMGVGFVLSEIRTLWQKPIATSQLAEAEQVKAAHYAESVEASNQKSANALGSGPVSADMSLQAQLVSVMEKVIFSHRSNSDSLHPNNEREDINWAAKSTLGFMQSNFGFLLGALGAILYTSLQAGINVEALLKASKLCLPDSQRLSEGPDQIKTTKAQKSNVSFMSNATRLSAAKTEQSTLSQSLLKTTYLSGEALSSRTLIIALCQSGAIQEMLRRLTKEEAQRIGPMPGFSNTCAASAEIMANLAENLLNLLNEAANAENRIPGLNQEVASQLASISKTTMITALSSNSLSIVPFLQSSLAIKNAAKNEENHQQEALSNFSSIDRMISEGLNTLQAFTDHCIGEFNALANYEPEYAFDAVMESQLTSNRISASTLMGACCFSLLCEEIMELALSRSLTLIDRNQLANRTQQSQAQSHDQTRAASAGILEDTRGDGQGQKSTNFLPAISLTLANLAISFENLASQLREQSAENNRDILKPDLQLHTSQRAMIKSMASMLSQYATTLLNLSGTLTRIPLLPIFTNGSIDEIRQTIHSSDGQLEFQRFESSAQSAREEHCESTLLTAITTDSLVNVQVNLSKLLLNSGTIVSEVGLSLSKLSEIVLSNLHPGEAMRLETQALSQPNGVSKNLSQKQEGASVGASIFTATFLGETQSNESESATTMASILWLQARVDARIDQCGMLNDEEEDSVNEENNRLGLKGFYEILIRLLAEQKGLATEGDDQAYKDLVTRFNRGGISLSRYHSAHGGLPNHSQQPSYPNPLITEDRFVGCDDADNLLHTFIRKLYKDELNGGNRSNSLNNRLKQELEGSSQSTKVKQTMRYIEQSIGNQLRQHKFRQKIITFSSRESHRKNEGNAVNSANTETQEMANLDVNRQSENEYAIKI